MKKVRIGSVGLGRLGLAHTENIANRIRNAELAAICDVDQKKLTETADRLGVANRYTSFEEIIAQKDLDAIVLVSPSGLHTKQISAALDAGKHIFSEKPLGVTIAECKNAEKAVESHPEKVFMLGFMRRFDESYQYAYNKISSGEIGKVILFRAYSQDPEKFIESSIAFSAHSGGSVS
ncbi:hypothetical protein AGMMS50293_17870 [Spirochaetia bacterium]|nr:hypothetical protein AGMMS50293_17870 [Spirochaetia bacterium]